MSQPTDLIRALYGAFLRGDIAAVLAGLHPEVSWTEAAGFPYGGTYVGPQAVMERVFTRLGAEWKGFSAVPHQFVTEGDTVVVLGEYTGTFRATGKNFRAAFAHVWKVENDKVVRFHQHTDTAIVRAAMS
jgi:ketosteroid isomerase-like protein